MCLEERADIVTDNYVLDDLLGLFDTHFPNNSLEDFEYRGSLGDFVHLSKTDRYMAKTKEQIKAFFKDFTNYSQESSKALMEDIYSKERMLNNLTPELVRDYLDGMNRDDKRRCLCDIIGIGYFDDKEGEKFQEWVNNIHEMKW